MAQPFDTDTLKFVTVPTFLAYTAGSALSGKIAWSYQFLQPIKSMFGMHNALHFGFGYLNLFAVCVIAKQVSRLQVKYGRKIPPSLPYLPIIILVIIISTCPFVFPNVAEIFCNIIRFLLNMVIALKVLSFVEYHQGLAGNAPAARVFIEGGIAEMFRSLGSPWLSYKLCQKRKLRAKAFTRGMACVLLCPCLAKLVTTGWAARILERQGTLPIPTSIKYITGTMLSCHPVLYLAAGLFLLCFEGFGPALGELSGTTDTIYYLDWYNSRTMRDYWRKWNLPVHNFLTKYTYIPVLKANMPALAASQVTFTFSGILHDYAMYILLGSKIPAFTVMLMLQPVSFEIMDLLKLSNFAGHLLTEGGLVWGATLLYVLYR